MRVITKPTIYVIGKQEVDYNEVERFLTDHNVEHWSTDTSVGGEFMAEMAGRVCYMSFAKPRPGGNEKYLGHIKEVGHGSVLEHPVWNFLITGVSRSFTHELVRHRAGVGYSQLSQRYVDESVAEYVVPPVIERLQGEAYHIWHEACKRAQEAYVRLVDVLSKAETAAEYDAYVGSQITIGMNPMPLALWLDALGQDKKTEIRKSVRSTARSVLPNATETKIFFTANARALRHILEMRGNKAAEIEIRRFAHELAVILKALSPNIFGDYTLGDNGLETPHRKV